MFSSDQSVWPIWTRKALGQVLQGEKDRFFDGPKYKELSSSVSDVSSEDDTPQPKTRSSCILLSRFTAIILFFTFLNALLAAVIWTQTVKESSHGTVPGFFPRAEYELRIFHLEELGPTDKAEQEWDKQGPPGHGFVVVDEPDKFGLPRGVPYGDSFKMYGISWAHQYHCLWMLRREFWRLIKNESELVGTDLRDDTHEQENLMHLAHCFGYLRDHVVCNMDMTLEWPTLKGDNEGIVNGYEIAHTCKKRQLLDNFVNAHEPDPALQKEPPGHHRNYTGKKHGDMMELTNTVRLE